MPARDSYTEFWNFLSQTLRDLILEGDYLSQDIIANHQYQFKDYSFLVFPYAKAYEGFLKELMKDIGFISHMDYISDHLRMGKLLSPNLAERLGDRSLYLKILHASSQERVDQMWEAWKTGRNQVFHYFPHNLKALTFQEAQDVIDMIVQAMEDSYRDLYPIRSTQHTI